MKKNLLPLLLLVPIPSIGTYYFLFGSPGAIGNIFLSIGKFWIVLLPLIWIKLIEKNKIAINWPNVDDFWQGAKFGLPIIIGAFILFQFNESIHINPDLTSKLDKIGLLNAETFLLGTIYWCFINSFIEEYVWRGFVLSKLNNLMSTPIAIVLASILFTLHHIIAVLAYFDFWATIIASFVVLFLGILWGYMRLKFKSIWPCYISHVCADIGFFYTVYLLLIK